jgi:Ca-activated chloride channel family protein
MKRVTVSLFTSALAACTAKSAAVAPMRLEPAVAGGEIAAPPPAFNTESYQHREDNPEIAVADAPVSTFSIDVDTASYANLRRFLEDGALPPADAVRIEEMINYFDYGYPDPADGPVAVVAEVGPSPFHDGRRLIHIGLQGRRPRGERPPLNLVFLIDTSGSMSDGNKLPLVIHGLSMLAERLRPADRVGIVVYAGAAGVVLEPTADRAQVKAALERLAAGGSTNGAQGIEAAYALAERNLDPRAVNRVVLCSDGDFNVGVTDQGSLVRLIEARRATGIYLTVLGFGTGNLKDSTMEALAQHGNGNYGYVDSAAEARKVLVDEMDGTMVTIADDVKVQVEFNPGQVASYRLLGYENRLLADRDFADDRKDAGELGAGQAVTAIYEIVPARGEAAQGGLKYQSGRRLTAAARSGELATVRVRYRLPGAERGQELAVAVADREVALARTSDDFRFSAAAAAFGMLLRKSEARGAATWSAARALAAGATAGDRQRADMLRLLDLAARLSGEPPATRAALAR